MADTDNNSMIAADGGTGLMASDGSENMADEQKSGFASAMGNVDLLRQITLIMALAICLAIAVFVIMWANQAEYRFLAKQPTEQLIKTMDFLDANQVEYRQENNTISVPSDQYQDIKILLAREGLSDEPSAGSEIIMQDMGFGVSQRLETERLKFSREQQLARTIEELQAISRAKVLLAIPRENIFAKRTRSASGTVVLTLRKGRLLSEEEVDSVVDIIASAVQGMEPNRVTVTDQNGRLLNSGSQTSVSSRSRKEFEMEKKRENEYLNKIDSILIPVVGLGNYTAQVNVTMDFTSSEEMQRRYNSDLPALRSEMKIEDNTIGGLLGGIPGALSNQPPLDSNIPENANGGAQQKSMPGRRHSESTKNYELDEAISHTKQQAGVVRRISVSVALDYLSVPGAEGATTQSPRSVEEMSNIRRLLQGSIGFNLQRGDVLEVVTLPFSREIIEPAPKVPFYENTTILKFFKLGMGALVIIVLILVVVKPMLKRLINPDQTPDDYGDKSLDSHIDLGDETMDMLTSEFDAAAVGFAPDGSLQLPDLHRDEDILKAVRALVANEPELSSQVVKSWLNEDE
ncbi:MULTISPECIES: flagellar basal-body MS-ring/collar protein FliF [unclassified Colwellia]|uniref:flagellar basal-body MS-ring/collar protein FliF n=1 Tax=unclassified Colwellia TaxID=196834 RepID=UPI0015F70EFC|nr:MULTISPECIES: flagellar basal-body MS-ring/collar protein FliF [unclassified Colwellia]MBA6233417.1 flagellar M-ring protein FliF [Colwellia sp. MB02u-7]MBA6236507.1 flagellar M-ring protein FliF [Colwellia sp. MB02u-11]MBA6257041.1 flagellar M-ring protein FliF [Colwellia sp. MB3u-28]MBA6260954.1 flagellar M-ring protein FliF [Colwellia sp. MB3u-41]MBA6298094.1 flagellar M-ring protein FliF [Colwellia sp. MB3u-22]